MDKLKSHFRDFLITQDFDAIALGKIDFSKNIFESFQIEKMGSLLLENEPHIFFDLASLSKVLCNGIALLAEEKSITKEMELVINHRGGLPAWGLLPKTGWKEIINSFTIKESNTLYSDYSALRFMLEFNKIFSQGLHEKVKKFWDREVIFWKDLKGQRTVQNGFIKGRPNSACVHDPNAYNLNTFVSHAGLFGSVEGVCKTLINLNEQFDLVKKMDQLLKNKHERFVNGWDTVENPNDTLAGNGCSNRTFGHLGFTGTSLWIDCERQLGYVLLTNATKSYWFDKADLNKFRRELGERIWQNQ